MTESDLIALAAARFSAPEWAFVPRVRDQTGFGATRTADALAMGLWPSRGLELIGFEMKVSRSDWLRELKAPAKAETFVGFCDHWYVVAADEKIVADGELPPTWGLMLPRGGGLVVKCLAPKLEAATFDRPFIASLLRSAIERNPDKEVKRAAESAAIERARKTWQVQHQHEVDVARADVASARRALVDFEKASGVSVSSYSAGNIGRAVKWVLSWQQRDYNLDAAESAAHRVVDAVKELRAMTPTRESG